MDAMTLKNFPAILLLASSAFAQGGTHLEGTWLGSLEVGPGTKLRLAFHVAKAAGGELGGTLDSIDQGSMGMQLQAVKITGMAVTMELQTPPASYSGTMNTAGTEIAGEWHQSGMSLALNLKKVDASPVLDRPQEPKEPLPYRAEDVTFPSKAAGVQLAGTLTYPETGGPFPAVLLITGSGAQDRDETLLGHKPFRVIADALTRQGIAVLRVDDRGTAKSSGNFKTATTADFVEDAAGSVEFLKTRKEVDARRIGLIGHSEGAVIAPLLANRSADVAFIVMMAGTGVRGSDVLREQTAAILRSSGAPGEAIATNTSIQKTLMALSDPKLDAAQLEARKKEAETLMMAQVPESQRAQAKAFIHGQVEEAVSPWMRYFVNYDPAPALRALKKPVLVLNGALDQQVLPEQNLPAIVQALEQGRNPDYTVVKFPGLNHLFQTAKTGGPSEYAQITETIAPVVLETIAVWIQKHDVR